MDMTKIIKVLFTMENGWADSEIREFRDYVLAAEYIESWVKNPNVVELEVQEFNMVAQEKMK